MSAPRSRARATCRALNSAPARDVPKRERGRVGASAPLEPVVVGDLIRQEHVDGLPQYRCCRRTALDHDVAASLPVVVRPTPRRPGPRSRRDPGRPVEPGGHGLSLEGAALGRARVCPCLVLRLSWSDGPGQGCYLKVPSNVSPVEVINSTFDALTWLMKNVEETAGRGSGDMKNAARIQLTSRSATIKPRSRHGRACPTNRRLTVGPRRPRPATAAAARASPDLRTTSAATPPRSRDLAAGLDECAAGSRGQGRSFRLLSSSAACPRAATDGTRESHWCQPGPHGSPTVTSVDQGRGQGQYGRDRGLRCSIVVAGVGRPKERTAT